MKTLFKCFIVMLISVISANAQSKLEFGAGLSYGLHYLDHTTDYNYTGYRVSPVHLLGVNAYLHLNTDKRFQFRLLTHLGQKDMVFSLRTLSSGSGTIVESIHHTFLSGDISVLGLYSFPQKNGSVLQPILGFYSSFSTFSGARWRQSLSGGGTNSGATGNSWVPSISNNPTITYVGVNAGLNYRTQIKGFPLELMGLFYISPASMFEFTFEYLDGLEIQHYEGRYHHLTLGVNIPIVK